MTFVSPLPCTLVAGVEPNNENEAVSKLVFAIRVVKMPVFGVVEPIAPGDSHVNPSRKLALRNATCEEEFTLNGGVPVVTSEVHGTLKVIPPVMNRTPLNVGEPLYVPEIEPPPPRVLGPSEVKPTLKLTGPLKLLVACQVFVPVQTLLVESKLLLEPAT